MQAIDNKVISRIYGRGRGWVFSKIDFIAEFGEANVHKALSNLEKAGKIRRVCRGFYDYPRYSELLKQQLGPDMDQVAHAIARRFNWRIQPSGDVALNLLGLSTQIPGRWLYQSDGPSREYTIGKQVLQFKNTLLKESGFKLQQSALLVQALKSLGKDRIDSNIIDSLRQSISKNDCERILKDTRTVTSWVYAAIKRVCEVT